MVCNGQMQGCTLERKILFAEGREQSQNAMDRDVISSTDMKNDVFSNLRSDSSGTESAEKKLNIMISYAWKHCDVDIYTVPRKIASELKKLGYDVWIDEERMRTDMDQCMATAVKDCDVFIACISEAYEASEHCQSEINMARDRKKRIVFVKVQKGFKPDGWLHVHTAGKLYLEFWQWNREKAFLKPEDNEAFHQKLMEMLKHIDGEKEKTSSPISATTQGEFFDDTSSLLQVGTRGDKQDAKKKGMPSSSSVEEETEAFSPRPAKTGGFGVRKVLRKMKKMFSQEDLAPTSQSSATGNTATDAAPKPKVNDFQNEDSKNTSTEPKPCPAENAIHKIKDMPANILEQCKIYCDYLKKEEWLKAMDRKAVIAAATADQCSLSASDIINYATNLCKNQHPLESVLFYCVAATFYGRIDNPNDAVSGIKKCIWGLQRSCTEMIPFDYQLIVQNDVLPTMRDLLSKIQTTSNLDEERRKAVVEKCTQYINVTEALVDQWSANQNFLQNKCRLQ